MPEGLVLEPAALAAARSHSNALVVAGPGAGKTELLAQRACYLLQTGMCPEPYRILAISFKRDAAQNLKDRVTLRCGRELASRFDSMTYDAFAKDLLDRFSGGLPKIYRPTANYEPLVGPRSYDDAFRECMLGLPDNECGLSERERQGINARPLVRVGMLGHAFPFNDWPNENVFKAGKSVWQSMLANDPSLLTFPMICRLAEYIVRSNPAVRRAIQETYKYAFLDEFQDSTTVQICLAEACFLKSNTILTAVGDSKQRIMGWAGALEGVFQRYQSSFQCGDPLVLKQNHRSRAVLVNIQSVFARELDADAESCSAAYGETDEGVCRVFEFDDEEAEALHLSKMIKDAIEVEGIPAHEICILCRARPDKFAATLLTKIRDQGVHAFVDVNRREIIAEPVASYILNLIELLGEATAPEAWESVCALLSEIEGDSNENERVSTMLKLQRQITSLSSSLPNADSETEDIVQFFEACLVIVGKERFAVLYPQYRRGNYIDAVIERLADLTLEELKIDGWHDLPDRVRGLDAASIMTMHKSKGLEFHTVIFLGLEDSALWNYEHNSDEETCGLFVALSRAKERCIFTFCKKRVGRYGRYQIQSRMSIGRIYELFEQAGVRILIPSIE